MAITSRKNGKKLRAHGGVPIHWSAEWAVEPAATEGCVNVTLLVKQTDDLFTSKRTYRYLLRRERASELMRKLNESLAGEAARENLESTTELVAANAALQAGAASSAPTADEDESPLGHFALGAYGLVGN